jgi:hypothetical protein
MIQGLYYHTLGVLRGRANVRECPNSLHGLLPWGPAMEESQRQSDADVIPIGQASEITHSHPPEPTASRTVGRDPGLCSEVLRASMRGWRRGPMKNLHAGNKEISLDGAFQSCYIFNQSIGS